jgi:uncharacterized protein
MSEAIIQFHDARRAHVDRTAIEEKLKKSGKKRLQVILKISERCNIACKYCYFFFMGDESYKDNPPYISSLTIRHLAHFVQDAVDKYDISNVLIILHGGEPLMMKPAQLEELIVDLRNNISRTQLAFSVQTNAALVNEEWINFFERHEIGVGVSLDGPEKYNDINRIDKKGRGSYASAKAGIDLLMDAANKGRIDKPGLLCVINPEFPVAEIFNHLVHDLGFRNIDFLLPDQNRDTLEPSVAEKIREYVRELFFLYRTNSHPDLRIRFFNIIMRAMQSSADYRRLQSRGDAERDLVLTVSSNGAISPDDILRSSNPALMRLGLNVENSTILDYLAHPTVAFLNKSSYSIPEKCLPCEFKNICQGGELYHRYSAASGFDEPSVYCETLKATYEEMASVLVSSGVPIETLIETLQAEVN